MVSVRFINSIIKQRLTRHRVTAAASVYEGAVQLHSDAPDDPKDQTRTATFNKLGIQFVNCHLHPNMSATIVVSPNRTGNFTPVFVPLGEESPQKAEARR